ncbi:hypothetical protein ACFCQI_12640 [Rhodanobacter sp. FW102-FHT14D06]|uniref:Uncharacterized protein n=2 Tax=unclassified Rhodanobacter TaxID=2621553 RepID=A0AB74UKA9_9GAMM
MKNTYTPSGYSQTSDEFAALMVDAPEFEMNGMSLAEAFGLVRGGIDTVISKSKSAQATALLVTCKSELDVIQSIFASNAEVRDVNVRKETRKRLQRLYYDVYLAAGPLLKSVRHADEIGPDDDV